MPTEAPLPEVAVNSTVVDQVLETVRLIRVRVDGGQPRHTSAARLSLDMAEILCSEIERLQAEAVRSAIEYGDLERSRDYFKNRYEIAEAEFQNARYETERQASRASGITLSRDEARLILQWGRKDAEGRDLPVEHRYIMRRLVDFASTQYDYLCPICKTFGPENVPCSACQANETSSTLSVCTHCHENHGPDEECGEMDSIAPTRTKADPLLPRPAVARGPCYSCRALSGVPHEPSCVLGIGRAIRDFIWSAAGDSPVAQMGELVTLLEAKAATEIERLRADRNLWRHKFETADRIVRMRRKERAANGTSGTSPLREAAGEVVQWVNDCLECLFCGEWDGDESNTMGGHSDHRCRFWRLDQALNAGTPGTSDGGES